MGLRLIYGRAGTGKSEKCYKEISEKIKQNNKNKCIDFTFNIRRNKRKTSIYKKYR